MATVSRPYQVVQHGSREWGVEARTRPSGLHSRIVISRGCSMNGPLAAVVPARMVQRSLVPTG